MTKQLLVPTWKKKNYVIQKISSDIVFIAYESRHLTALQQRKGVENFLGILRDFSAVTLHERALSKITTSSVFPCCNVNTKNVFWPLGPLSCLNLVIKLQYQALTFFFFLLGAWEKMIYLKLFFDQWLIQLRDKTLSTEKFWSVIWKGV